MVELVEESSLLEDASQVTGEKSDVTTSKVAAEDDLANDGTSERGTGSMLSQLLTAAVDSAGVCHFDHHAQGLIGENCDRCARAASKQDDTHDGGFGGTMVALFGSKPYDASGIMARACGRLRSDSSRVVRRQAIVYRHAQAPQ